MFELTLFTLVNLGVGDVLVVLEGWELTACRCRLQRLAPAGEVCQVLVAPAVSSLLEDHWHVHGVKGSLGLALLTAVTRGRGWGRPLPDLTTLFFGLFGLLWGCWGCPCLVACVWLLVFCPAAFCGPHF